MRKVLILRPQPGADRTAESARDLGLEPVVAPIFVIRPLGWTPPDPDGLDAVMLTSAHAARRCGGEVMAPFRRLPCYAVGETTASAAREAGFGDVRTGPSDGAALMDMMAADEVGHALHPCGREHIAYEHRSVSVHHVPVYVSEAVPALPMEAKQAIGDGAVVLLHSQRAAVLFADLLNAPRGHVRIAAISPAVAEAAGSGWDRVEAAPAPRDEALLELAAKLCQTEGEEESSEA